ncbi:MAG: hypothetical protein WKF57_06220 [Nakamurella sp.]
MKRTILIVVAAALVLTGCSTPTSTTSTVTATATTVTTAPAKTVTKTVMKTKTDTTTVTSTETTVPAVCVEALEEADKLSAISIEMATAASSFLGVLGEYFDSSSYNFQDADALQGGLSDYVDVIKESTEKVQANDYGSKSGACRRAGN